MSRPGCDVVVVGLGVAGSSAARELARRGLSVVGLDRFGPDHRRGSSHGESRLFRLLYHEAPHYVPLLRRARAAWGELEEETGRELFLETGGLAVGPPGGELVTGCLSTAAEHELAFDRLTPGETRRRFPAFRPGAEQETLVDPAAGVLRADRCVAALRAVARRAGAELRFGQRVRRWSLSGDGLTVETGGGELSAGALLVAAGGWTADLLEEAGEPRPPLTVERQTVHRFPAPGGGEYGPERFPGPGARGESGRPPRRGAEPAPGGRVSPPRPERGRAGPRCRGRSPSGARSVAPGRRDLSLHRYAGPGLPDRSPPRGRSVRRRGHRLLGPRLQVRPGRGPGGRRPPHGRADGRRHGAVPPGTGVGRGPVAPLPVSPRT